MRFFPATLSREESDAGMDRLEAGFEQKGISFWAAEMRADGRLVGFIGLKHVADNLPFAPTIEIGWRLARHVWGQGLAPEGARAALAYAFSALKAAEVVSFTPAVNVPSRRVMEKIGMTRDATGDFLHPNVPEGHALQPHVLYRIKAA